MQQWMCERLSGYLNIPWGQDHMIASREMGQNGTDVRLIGEAQTKFPFSIECKNQETWSIGEWVKQAKKNQKPGTDWLLLVGKNRTDSIIVMDAEAFLKMYFTQEKLHVPTFEDK